VKHCIDRKPGHGLIKPDISGKRLYPGSRIYIEGYCGR
jgi:hypothetical protein